MNKWLEFLGWRGVLAVIVVGWYILLSMLDIVGLIDLQVDCGWCADVPNKILEHLITPSQAASDDALSIATGITRPVIRITILPGWN